MAGSWTRLATFGPEDMRASWNETLKTLVPPSVVLINDLSGNAASLYADTAGSIPLANPLPTGGAIGTPGLDLMGNAAFCAAPGLYVPVIDGLTYAPVQLNPHPDDLLALLGGTVATPSVVKTLTTDLVSVDSPTQILVNDLRGQITAGDPGFRFSGQLRVSSTLAAGFIVSIIGSTGAGADLSFTMWEPQADIGFARFGAAPASGDFSAAFGSSATEVNLFFQGSGRGTATQGMQFRFHQKTTTGSVNTTVKAWHSWCAYYPSPV